MLSSPLFLQATFDTEKGYIINISDEALQRSRSKQEGDEDSVNLIVSLLNKTIFMASGSSHIEVHRSTLSLSSKDLFNCQIKSEFILWYLHFTTLVYSWDHLSLWY